MATAPDPDSVLGSTCGRDNFQRLSRLLISGGTTLLRETFDSKCPPTVLPGILNNPATKKQLKAAKLTKPQWDCLYPSPGTYGKSEDFDVTLLFRLLRTICSLTPPTTGWDVLPASTDHTLEADLARIKYYRNSVYGHVNQNMDINVDDFLRLWQDIRQALVRIARKIRPERETEWRLAIDNFLKDRLTAEDERNVQELQKWYKEDMDVKESIEKLVDTTQKINKSMEEVKEDVALLRLRVDCVAIAQPDQREETPGMAGNGNRPPPTAQDVLNLVSQKYLQKIDPSTPEEFNGFLDYLSNARQLLFVNAKRGSLIITLGCRSLQILDDLWKDYCIGRLNEMAQKYLVTKELLNELGLTEAKLTTSISEGEYRSCRNQLSVYAGLRYKSFSYTNPRSADLKMATAPDPDRVLGSTCGRDNFQRLSRLLISGGTTLLRETFDSKCPPTVLPGILNNPATKKQLKAAKLTKPQWDCLYPSPGTYGKSEDFDVTLLFRLLRTICSLTPPTTGWDVLPASTDHSLEADLARIKYYRNSVYGHVNQNMDIKVDDFLRLWQDISQALVRIAKKIRPERETEWRLAIDNFLKDRLTAEDERNVQELQKWYKEDMNVKESIEKLVKEVKECRNEFRVCKRISFPNCNEVDVALLRLMVDCVAIAQPDQREETPGTVENGNRPPPTAQDVLNLVSQKYLQNIDPASTPEEFNGFLDYLSNAQQLLFVNAKRRGSLIITVGCSSLQILDDLWKDYCTGRLNEMAQKYLVTKELLNELGLTEAKLTTSISEGEYRSCRNQLSVYAGLEQKIKLLKKGRDALQNQFFNWAWARGIIRFRALQIQSIENPRGTSESLVGIAALVGGTVAMLFTFGMSMVYGEAVAASKVAAVGIGAAGTAVYERHLAALVSPRGSFIGLIGATVTAVAAVAAAADFGCRAALIGAAIALSFIFGMSKGYGNASSTHAVATVAIGAAGAAVNRGDFAAEDTFIALIGAAAAATAATAAFGWEATLVGAAITLLFTFGMSVVYGTASAIGAVEAVAAGAAGAAVNKGVFAPLESPRRTFIGLILAAITTATAFGWKAALVGAAIALSSIFGMSVGYGNAIATGAVAVVAIGAAGATVNEGVFAALVGPRGIFIALVGAAAAATAAFGWEATLVGAAITMLFTFGMSVVYGNASATGAVAAVAAGAVVGAVVGVLVVSFNAIRVRNELLKLLLEENMELLRLKSNVEPLKHCVADLAVYCREHTDQVLSSRLMAREFPFFCDILLKKEAKVRVIRLTLSALLEKESKVDFKRLINLPKRLGNGEDSGIINTKILLDELNEGPNDEEIRAMIVDFIEKEFAFFFLSSDQPGLGDPNKCYSITKTKNSNNA